MNTTYNEISNLLARNSTDATKNAQAMLGTLHELSLKMAGMTSLLEETTKQTVQLEQIIQIIPMLSETANEVREISHSMRLAEQRDQGMSLCFVRTSTNC